MFLFPFHVSGNRFVFDVTVQLSTLYNNKLKEMKTYNCNKHINETVILRNKVGIGFEFVDKG